MMKLELEVHGENADNILGVMSAYFQDEFNITPERVEKSTDDHQQKDPALVVAFVAAVIAIPPAVLATIDLLKRRELRKKLEDKQKEIQKLCTDEKDIVQITINMNVTLNLRDDDAGKIIEALENEADKE